MPNNRRRRQQVRRQQVRRQLIIAGGLFVLAAVTFIGFKVQYSDKKNNEAIAAAKNAAKTVKQEKEATPKIQDEEKQETEEERLARVKSEAVSKGYPAGVIELLDKNKETVQFVEEYESKRGNPSAESIGTGYTKGQIPQLLQWDERWGYAPYGTSIIAVSGCGPTCLSMVVSGLTGDWSVTPAAVAAYGTENNYLDEDNNTYWKFMEEAPANWNISVKEVPLVEARIAEELQAGHPIICSVRKGDFTQDGHFIVLTGYSNGSVTVNDPFSMENSEKPWVFQDIQNQIAAMWSYSL